MRFTPNHPVSYPVFEVSDDLTSLSIKGSGDISRTAKLALAAALEAIENAGLDREMLRSKRVGVCLGTSVGNAMNSETFHRQFRKDEEPEMAPIARYLRSNPVDVLAKEYDLTGPCQTVVNACSSGTDAIGLGALWIQSGLCDMVLAGGADELCHVTYNGFISLMITDDSPCKPFDLDRKGLNLGEGAAVLVLESEKSRQTGQKQARAFVLGYGASCDAHHLTAPHPEGRGLRRATTPRRTTAPTLVPAGRTCSWRTWWIGRTWRCGRRTCSFRPGSLPVSRPARTPNRVHLVSIGATGPAALHAAALEPGLFASVTLRRCLRSWSDVVHNPLAVHQLINAVHGALLVYDLPDLVATLPAGTITIEEPVDAEGKAGDDDGLLISPRRAPRNTEKRESEI